MYFMYAIEKLKQDVGHVLVYAKLHREYIFK